MTDKEWRKLLEKFYPGALKAMKAHDRKKRPKNRFKKMFSKKKQEG